MFLHVFLLNILGLRHPLGHLSNQGNAHARGHYAQHAHHQDQSRLVFRALPEESPHQGVRREDRAEFPAAGEGDPARGHC